MQLALNKKPHYVIEVLSERFDQLNKEDQTKVLIHEILHVPHSFGGGFRSHKPFVTRAKVQRKRIINSSGRNEMMVVR